MLAALPQRTKTLNSAQTAEGSTGFLRTLGRRIAKPAIQRAARNIPYGNVHTGLMVGPLIIENGIPE
jgi:hypothetical protein